MKRKLKRNIVKQLVVSLPNKGSSAKVITSSFLPVDLSDVVLQAESPSGNKLLILRCVSNDKGKKSFVEVRMLINLSLLSIKFFNLCLYLN